MTIQDWILRAEKDFNLVDALIKNCLTLINDTKAKYQKLVAKGKKPDDAAVYVEFI
jgi:hypothetical protein